MICLEEDKMQWESQGKKNFLHVHRFSQNGTDYTFEQEYEKGEFESDANLHLFYNDKKLIVTPITIEDFSLDINEEIFTLFVIIS